MQLQQEEMTQKEHELVFCIVLLAARCVVCALRALTTATSAGTQDATVQRDAAPAARRGR